MAELPSASVIIDDEAGAFGGGTGYAIVIGCVESNADITPRVFASTKSLLTQHGYSPAVDYAALHFEATKKPIIFVGLPQATAGTIGRQNDEGVAGSCNITVAAGTNGVLEEVDGVVTVTSGGTIGTDQIVFTLSLDGGVTEKTIRLGTSSSYTIPYVGMVLNFGAGDLDDDDVYTFSSTAPMWDSDGMTSARQALAAQQKLARTFLVAGDVTNSTFAGYVNTAANAYETSSDRFVVARCNVRDRLPLATMAQTSVSMTGNPSVTFAEVGATGDTITSGSGSFVTDGFEVGMVVTVTGSVSNNVSGPITAVTATVLTFDTTDLVAEGPVSSVTIVGSHALTFAEVGGTGDTITRSGGSWLADGFRVGDVVTIDGTASNDVSDTIAALSATVMTFGSTDLAAEVIASNLVTITKGETMASWVSSMDAAFASVNGNRIDIGLGRLRKLSPITGWSFRRPVAWAASIREYQHDVHIPTWRKTDGPLLDWGNTDADTGQVVEYDDRTDSGGLAGRFTCARTYANGPTGAFIALSLTRGTEGSLLSRTHNMQVANLACTVCHAETENAIGQVLVLNDDGTGSDESLTIIEERVNSALQIALLQNRAEGKRATKARWSASRTDVLNIPGAEVTGTLDLLLNGTIEKITTRVRIQTGG